MNSLKQERKQTGMHMTTTLKSVIDSYDVNDIHTFTSKIYCMCKDIKRVDVCPWLTNKSSPNLVSEIIVKSITYGRIEEHDQVSKDTFKDYIKLSETLLSFVCELLQISVDLNVYHEPAFLCNLKQMSSSLMHVSSGHILSNPWTSEVTMTKAKRILQLLQVLYQVDSYADLLNVSLNVDESDITSFSSSLYGNYLFHIQNNITKTNWQKYPFSKASFIWTLFQVKFPSLSSCIDQVLPLPLNMVDDFVIENKVFGVQCLHHIIMNVSNEELRWYGRAEVVYEAIKHQLYTKDVILVPLVHVAVLAVLKVVEKMPAIETSRYDEVFKMILCDVEMEDKLPLRQSLTTNVPAFIDVMGITVVRHTTRVIRVVTNYLEIYDGPKEISRVNALKILKTLLLNAWPRVPQHSKMLLKCLLKFLYDIGTGEGTTPKDIQTELYMLAKECLILLRACDTQTVTQVLKAVSKTDTIDFVKQIAYEVSIII